MLWVSMEQGAVVRPRRPASRVAEHAPALNLVCRVSKAAKRSSNSFAPSCDRQEVRLGNGFQYGGTYGNGTFQQDHQAERNGEEP